MREFARRPGAALAALVVAALAAGCAKKGPPTGGPPDLEPPHIVSAVPDSGAAGVGTHPLITVTFSEGMEPRSSGDALEFAPPIAIRQRRWSGNTLTLVLKDSLRADHTYTLFVGSGARDRHGNALAQPRTVVFTTSEHFPPGRIEGNVEAVGFRAPGTALWCYRDGRKPDSTARDFDALGIADAKGDFTVSGLAPGSWRVWGFADLNHNRSFEPAADLLVAADTTVVITTEQPVGSGIRLHMVDPRAPGHFAGSIIDTVSDHSGVVRLIVASMADTSRRLLYDVPDNGGFDYSWDPGSYRVRAFRDVDRNKVWKRDEEPGTEEIVVKIEPGSITKDVIFVLVRAHGAAPQ